MAINFDSISAAKAPGRSTMVEVRAEDDDQTDAFLRSVIDDNDMDDDERDDTQSENRFETNLHPTKGIYGNRFSMAQSMHGSNALALSTASLGSKLNLMLDHSSDDDDDDGAEQ